MKIRISCLFMLRRQLNVSKTRNVYLFYWTFKKGEHHIYVKIFLHLNYNFIHFYYCLTLFFFIIHFSGPLSEVQSAVNLEASLPCDLTPSAVGIPIDKVQLVIWYKEGHVKPIYSWVIFIIIIYDSWVQENTLNIIFFYFFIKKNW